ALFDGEAALPDMEDQPRPESLIVDHTSSQSSKASLPLPALPPPSGGMMDKPRVCVSFSTPPLATTLPDMLVDAGRFDGREGFQLYDLRGKPGPQSHIVR
ncbi:hypothetical protein FRC06_009582, partial [Ceratobasidium sp. 370]